MPMFLQSAEVPSSSHKRIARESCSLVMSRPERKQPLRGLRPFWIVSIVLFSLLGLPTTQAQDAASNSDVFSSTPTPLSPAPDGVPNPALQLRNFAYPDASRLLGLNGTVGSFRNNFCDASYRVLVSKEVPLERALAGWALRVALLQSGDLASFDFDDDGRAVRLNAEYPGLMPLILDEICERAGCTWRNSFASISKKLEANQSFSDLLMWTTDVYDISINFWSRSIERLEAGATFTESWYDGSIIMVAPQEPPGSDSFDPWGWLAPFDRNVWVMIVVTIVVSTLVYWLLEVVFSTADDHMMHSDDGMDLWEKLQPWETLWRFGTAFAGQFEFEPTTGPAYLFSFSVAFWALLMGAAYTANLASFLVIRNRPKIPVNTVDEAVQREERICVRRGTQMDASVTNRFPTYAESNKFIRIRGQERDVFFALRDGVCDIGITEAAAWNIFQRDETVNSDCNLEWIGRPLQSIPASFGVKSDAGTLCTSLLRDVFNVHLIKMEAEGVIDELWDRHIDRTATIDCAVGGGSDEDLAARRRRQRRKLEQQQEKHRSVEQEEEQTIQVPDQQSTESSSLCSHHAAVRRNLKSARAGSGAEGAVAASAGPGDGSTKLSLINMGGVFLLHGILSTISLVCAIIMWAWKRGYIQRIILRRPTEKMSGRQHHTNQRENEFFRPNNRDPPSWLSHAAENPEEPLGRRIHFHDKHDLRRLKNGSFRSGSLKVESSAAGFNALQLEMNDRFNAIEERLASLSQLHVIVEQLKVLSQLNVPIKPLSENGACVVEPPVAEREIFLNETDDALGFCSTATSPVE